MRVLFDDEAMKAGRHVRIEFNSAKTELEIGTTTANMLGFNKGMPVYTIDRDRVTSQRAIATIVDYYAKVNRVSPDVTASVGVMRTYRLNPGTTIDGNV